MPTSMSRGWQGDGVTKQAPKHRRTEEPKANWLTLLVLWFLGSLAFDSPAGAQDAVILSTAADPAARLKKTGQILDYTGTELKLRTALGTDETIPGGRVVEIQTRWTPSHEAARAARHEGRLDDAVALFRQAKRDETRPWAVRQIMADLAQCYLEAGRIDSAGDEFLGILASDPVTQHFDCIPLAWRGIALGSAVEARAAAWLAARGAPAAVLLGASWLLPTRRGEAVAALEEIAKSTDPRLAGLAAIQLWRVKLVTATTEEIRRWQTQLQRMPADVQPTGWYVLGDMLARQDQPEAAALAYLKVPVLFRQQRALASEALLAAGQQLEKMSQADQATGLYREVVRDYPRLPATTEAEKWLERLKRLSSER
jgi:tetratricopeptide (TPR) repeat protein